ncbi:MAG TPA: sugar phosphate nucleotidyltransferase [Candidatus Krumholzibacteria bacterium]|nr:sugar phosphate nucleotidyltransferase [Candidatus Krumholzibacteria bacterium]
MIAAILAGGVGERFWPQSRRRRPKQLLDLTGRGTMLDLTLQRLDGLARPEDTLVMTFAEQRTAVLAQLKGRIPEANVIGEPDIRNTAPSIGLAAAVARKTRGDQPMLVLPADHLIDGVDRFREQVRAGVRFIESDGATSLLTFGIVPTRPETGYGYIRAGAQRWNAENAAIFSVEAFLEKPTAERAVQLVADGCLWNSGMFLWRAGAVLDGIATHQPELAAVLARIEAAVGTPEFGEVLKREYPRAPSVSIDYGLLEKSRDVVAMRADFAWNDVGSWEFVRETGSRDAAGNVTVGEHVVIDARENTVVAPGRVVALIGVEGLVVVDAGDAILVCRRDRVQDIKQIVAELKRRGRDDLV